MNTTYGLYFHAESEDFYVSVRGGFLELHDFLEDGGFCESGEGLTFVGRHTLAQLNQRAYPGVTA